MSTNEIGFFKNPYGEFDTTGAYKNGGYNYKKLDCDDNIFQYEKVDGNIVDTYLEYDEDNDGIIDIIQRCVADMSDPNNALTLLSEVYYAHPDEYGESLYVSNVYNYDEDKNFAGVTRAYRVDGNNDGDYESVYLSQYADEDFALQTAKASYEDYDFDGTFDSFQSLEFDEDGQVTTNTSNVVNQYHNGDTYQVQWGGTKAVITNTKTNQVMEGDLADIIANSDDKEKLLEVLQYLPGEVLVDILNEANFDTCERADNRSYFSAWSDKIFLASDQVNASTVAHELGHAIDYASLPFSPQEMRRAFHDGFQLETMSSQLQDIYLEEINAYLETGNERWSETFDPEREISVPDNNAPGAYCTYNVREMFAESYQLIMTGDCSSKECIEKYFPKTFELITQMLNEKRAGYMADPSETSKA